MTDPPPPWSDPPPADRAGASTPTALVYHEAYQRHDTGPGHPESAWRCVAIMARLAEADFAGRLLALRPRAAEPAQLLTCHTPEYLRTAERDIRSGMSCLRTGDTDVCPESFDAALLSAGGVLTAVDAVVSARARNAFCVVRPPGHHATSARGMGFCVFNNVAVATRYAQAAHGVGKVLIVDWDVHHGNGTQEIFYEDASVLYFSMHQWPWYPGTGSPDETGSGAGRGTTLNRPLQSGAGHEEAFAALTDHLLPAADAFAPELVLISAGFDSRLGDPLGGLALSDEDFAEMTTLVTNLAARHAGGRVVSVLEGGYDPAGLPSAAEAHVRALCGGA